MPFTRPHLTPLGIDLAEIGGGGSCPAQFEGLRRYSRDLTDWCATAPDRYIQAYWSYGDRDEPTGWRTRRAG